MTFARDLREAVEDAVAPLRDTLRDQAMQLKALTAAMPPAMGSKKDAARILGISERSVSRAIERGEIQARRVGGRIVVDLASLRVVTDEDVWRAEQGPPDGRRRR